jgi:hypothetical protein
VAYITKQEALDAANARVQRKFSATAKSVLKEEVQKQNVDKTTTYDVFLSHSSEDAQIVLGIYQILLSQGLKVYVDWIEDAQLNRANVSAETADLLRERMKASMSMLVITTKNSTESKWIPWELGYFDGHNRGLVGILPVLDRADSTFKGQEYFGLYPVVTRLPVVNQNRTELFVVENAQRGYRELATFAKGATAIRAFS